MLMDGSSLTVDGKKAISDDMFDVDLVKETNEKQSNQQLEVDDPIVEGQIISPIEAV
jgi:hypothetical protein